MNQKEIKFTGRYLSEFLSELPSRCILNKGITGCGGTTVELQSKRNSIILCPTKNLVTSKKSEDYFGVDGDVTITQIKEYLYSKREYYKFVATYDALERLMNIIPNYESYFLLIDEYHLLFNDYSFRSKPIRFILDHFKEFKDWCFMTATPLKEEFILKELEGIEQINYIWENAIPVKIKIKDTYFVQKILLEYIESMKDKNLHIFLNSVSTIYSLAKQLSPDYYRVVCSENSKTKIKNFAKINSPVKKVNFYTSCAFEGCDIFDPDGVCIIVCDTNISSTILDISTKVRQVCGRLRNSKYNNICHLILNTSKHRYAGVSKEDFDLLVNKSEKLGKKAIKNIESGEEDYELMLRVYTKEKYTSIYVNKTVDDQFFYDENLKKMDIYNYNLISEIYSSSISVLGEMEKSNIIPTLEKVKPKEGKDWITKHLIPSKEYTYHELEELFTPIFKEHNLKWNKNTSLKIYFPKFDKKKKTINGKRDVYYSFKI